MAKKNFNCKRKCAANQQHTRLKTKPIRKNGHQVQRKREAYCSDRTWEWTST